MSQVPANPFASAIRLPSAKFPAIGTAISGSVLAMEMGTVPEFDDRGKISGNKLDDDGNELLQVDLTLETAEGRVMLHTGGAIFYAIGRALAEIGAESLDIGDQVEVAYVGDGEPTAKGRNAPKQYAAVVTKSDSPVTSAA